MNRRIRFVLLLIGLLSYVFISKISTPVDPSNNSPAEVSGAYEALSFLGARQTYPALTLPANAHYAAWEEWQANSISFRGDPPLPWESLGPHNRGGRTLAIALNPQNANTLFAGSASGGLWRSTTAGVGAQAWERVEIGFPVLGVSAITFHPSDSMIMYIGTGEVYNYEAAGTGAAYRNTRGSYGMGILKTTDGGETWSKSLDWSYQQQRGVWMIKIDPTNPDIIYAATTEGIYKTTDAGLNWGLILDVVMGTDLLIHPDNPNTIVAACGNFASPGFGIYKTENGGVSWQQISLGLPTFYLGKIQLGMAPSNPNTIYASIGNGFSSAEGASWLCRSNNFGTSWTIKNTEDYSRWQGWFSHDVAVSPADPDVLIAVGINVWGSVDGGDSLTKLTSGGTGFSNPSIEGPDGDTSYVHSDAHDVLFHPSDPSKVFVASDGGIHRSDDGGATWYSANGGYQTVQFYNGTSTSQNNTDFFIGGLQDNGTIRWNGDLTWRRVTGGDGSWTAIHPLVDDVFFTSSQRLNILRTHDGGETFSWTDWEDWGNSYLEPASFIAPFVLSPSNGLVLYAGSRNMAKSYDIGATWVAINNGNPLDGNPILSMEVSPQNEDVVYAGTAPYEGERGHVFVTMNGNAFTDITEDLPDRYPMDITVDPTDPAVAYVVFSGFGTGHVFKTENYGQSWEDISGNLPDVPTNAVIVDPLFPNHVYVGNDLGVFVSQLGGTQWEAYQDGLPLATMVFDLKIFQPNRKLRVVTHGNGAYERDLLNEPVAVDHTDETTAGFQAFPNPVDDLVTIQLERETAGPLQLELLDANGRRIKTIPKETLSFRGQTIVVDLSTVSAGVYFVRLTNGEGQSVQRLVKS